MARRTLTLVYRQLFALKVQAEAGRVDPAQLARFLDELKNTLDVLGEVATEAYNKGE